MTESKPETDPREHIRLQRLRLAEMNRDPVVEVVLLMAERDECLARMVAAEERADRAEAKLREMEGK